MKMKMFYLKDWGPEAVAIGHEDDLDNRYNLYVQGMLWAELRRPEDCQVFLNALDQAEHEGGDVEIQFNDKAWGMDVRAKTVTIWSTSNDEWVDTFSHTEIRRAVEGWMKLLQMPDSPESQIIVDLGGEK